MHKPGDGTFLNLNVCSCNHRNNGWSDTRKFRHSEIQIVIISQHGSRCVLLWHAPICAGLAAAGHLWLAFLVLALWLQMLHDLDVNSIM